MYVSIHNSAIFMFVCHHAILLYSCISSGNIVIFMYFYSGNIAKHFAHFIDKRESRVNDNVHSTLGFSSRGSVGTTKESCLDPGQIFPLTSECPGTSPQHTLVALLARFDIISTMRYVYKFTILTFCDFGITWL
uniref:Uncharacterized protein n=1 Tax=Cacopsylla melanoneura TaxID=428564 RepID=A0A8D9FES7_9HEMI